MEEEEYFAYEKNDIIFIITSHRIIWVEEGKKKLFWKQYSSQIVHTFAKCTALYGRQFDGLSVCVRECELFLFRNIIIACVCVLNCKWQGFNG